MQLKNIEVLGVLQGLNTISQQKLPIRLAWKITTATRALQEFSKALDEPMQEIRMKHALRDGEGNVLEAFDDKGEKLPNTIQIPNEKIETVNVEMNELMNQVVEVHNVQFSLSDFPEKMELEPSVLNMLMPVLKEEQTSELKLVP